MKNSYFEDQFDLDGQGHQFRSHQDMYDVDLVDQKKSSNLKGKFKMVQSYQIHRELDKHLNFLDKFDLEGQGQFSCNGKIPYGSI